MFSPRFFVKDVNYDFIADNFVKQHNQKFGYTLSLDPDFYKLNLCYSKKMSKLYVPLIKHQVDGLLLDGHFLMLRFMCEKRLDDALMVLTDFFDSGTFSVGDDQFQIIKTLNCYEVKAKTVADGKLVFIRVERNVAPIDRPEKVCGPTIQRAMDLYALVYNTASYRNRQRFIKPRFFEDGMINCMILPFHLSLACLMKRLNRQFKKTTAIFLAQETLYCIQDVHYHYHLHRNVSPSSFFIGHSADCDSVYVANLTYSLDLSRIQLNNHLCKVDWDYMPCKNLLFCSRAHHLGQNGSFNDDMESWLYLVLYFLKPDLLPWLDCDDEREVYLMKKTMFNLGYQEHLGDIAQCFEIVFQFLDSRISVEADKMECQYMIFQNLVDGLKRLFSLKTSEVRNMDWGPAQGDNVRRKDSKMDPRFKPYEVKATKPLCPKIEKSIEDYLERFEKVSTKRQGKKTRDTCRTEIEEE